MIIPTILLIEDDENDVFVAKIGLEKAEITSPLHVATNGKEALAYIDGTGQFSDRVKYPIPYLILLDLKLPYVMGLEILKQIRERPEFDNTVVIVFTSSNSPSDIATAYQLRANAYLVKPAGIDVVETLFRSIKDFWLTHNQRS